MSFKDNPEQAAAAGRKGAATTQARLGSDFYQRIGKKGGTTRRAQLGAEGYRALGHKGGTNRWARQRAREAAGE